MYLTDCRSNNPGTGRWFFQDGRVAGSSDLDDQLEVVDATLNSWSTAHDVFDQHQGDKEWVSGMAFASMRDLVHKVRRDQYGGSANTYTSWPNEAITWALLTRWITVRQAQLKIERKAAN